MRSTVALCALAAFAISLLGADAAQAGWKENYREKYSKKTVKPGSAEEKRIRTLANMDFTYNKNWNYGSKRESSDKFTGYNTNVTPRNVSQGEPREEKVGYTLTGIIRDTGRSSIERLGVSEKLSGSVK